MHSYVIDDIHPTCKIHLSEHYFDIDINLSISSSKILLIV